MWWDEMRCETIDHAVHVILQGNNHENDDDKMNVIGWMKDGIEINDENDECRHDEMHETTGAVSSMIST